MNTVTVWMLGCGTVGQRVRLASELWVENGKRRARVSALTLPADHPLRSPVASRNGL